MRARESTHNITSNVQDRKNLTTDNTVNSQNFTKFMKTAS